MNTTILQSLLIAALSGLGVWFLATAQQNQMIAGVIGRKSEYSARQITTGAICIALAIYVYISTK